MTTKMNKQTLQAASGFIALALLLTYTWVHTGALLAGYVHPAFVGYLAAAGIELSVVSLSLRLGELRKAKANAGFMLLTLLAVCLVSAIANIAAGFEVAQGVKLTLDSVSQLDVLQGVIGISATALISLIVLALSEVVGSDVQLAVKIAANDAKAQAKLDGATVKADVQTLPIVEAATVQNGETSTSLDKANMAKLDNKQAGLDATLQFIGANPGASLADIGAAIGRSRQTAGNYVNELAQAGLLHRNGNGLELAGGVQ